MISGSTPAAGAGTGDSSNVGGLVGLNEVLSPNPRLGQRDLWRQRQLWRRPGGEKCLRIEKSKASGSVVGIGSDIQVGGLVGYHE